MCMCLVYCDVLKKKIILCLVDWYILVYIYWFYMWLWFFFIFKYYKLYNKIKVDLIFLKVNSLYDSFNDSNFFYIIGDILYIFMIDVCILNSI